MFALTKPEADMKKTGTMLVFLASFISFGFGFAIPARNPAESPRTIRLFDPAWKFHLGDVPGASDGGFDDSKWRVVNLPHDWSIELPFDAKHASGTGYLPGGIG
jgi:hypothetical protein